MLIVKSSIKSSIKRLLNYAGWDLVRYHHNPENSLLGLGHRPIRTVLDIGANIGQSARVYRGLFPDATIYCFEPLPDAYQTLSAWSRTQNGKVKVFNVALGNNTGHAKMNHHINFSPSSSLLKTTAITTDLYPKTHAQREITVEMAKLDDFVGQMDLNDETLVKMDVQGYEMSVMQGGESVLQQAVGCIIEVSLRHLYEGQPSLNELSSSLHNLGFVYGGNLGQAYDAQGRVVFVDAEFKKKGIV